MPGHKLEKPRTSSRRTASVTNLQEWELCSRTQKMARPGRLLDERAAHSKTLSPCGRGCRAAPELGFTRVRHSKVAEVGYILTGLRKMTFSCRDTGTMTFYRISKES